MRWRSAGSDASFSIVLRNEYAGLPVQQRFAHAADIGCDDGQAGGGRLANDDAERFRPRAVNENVEFLHDGGDSIMGNKSRKRNAFADAALARKRADVVQERAATRHHELERRLRFRRDRRRFHEYVRRVFFRKRLHESDAHRGERFRSVVGPERRGIDPERHQHDRRRRGEKRLDGVFHEPTGGHDGVGAAERQADERLAPPRLGPFAAPDKIAAPHIDHARPGADHGRNRSMRNAVMRIYDVRPDAPQIEGQGQQQANIAQQRPYP